MKPRMTARLVLIAGWMCSSPCWPASTEAGTFTVFGPELFERVDGAPVTVARQFSVLDPSAEYVLRIRNGGLADSESELASSSLVTLNGMPVTGPQDFSQMVGELQRPVVLEGVNELTVELRGKPGGAIAVDILGTDNAPPTITASVNPLPNAAGWNNTNVVVHFVCDDSTSGIASCSQDVTVVSEGEGQTFEGTAVDSAGNTATTTVTVNIDKTAPSVELTWPPADTFGTDLPTVPVEGALSDGLSGVEAADLVSLLETLSLGPPAFQVEASLHTVIPEGQPAIETGFQIDVTDVAGNSASHSFRVLHTTASTVDPTDSTRTELVDGVRTSIDRALVGFGPDASGDDIHAVIRGYGGRVAGLLHTTNTAVAEFDTETVAELQGLLETLESEPHVLGAAPDFFLMPDDFDNDHLPGDPGSGIYPAVAYDHIRLTAGANLVIDNVSEPRPVAVTIIDTGLDTTFGSSGELNDIRFFDLCEPEGQLGQMGTPVDLDPHGSAVAGVVAGANNGVGNNGVLRGITGSAFTVNMLRASCEAHAGFPWSLVAVALEMVVSDTVGPTDTVNLSLGRGYEAAGNDALIQAIKDFYGQYLQSPTGSQILWVMSSGNDNRLTDCGGDFVHLPSGLACDLDNVVSVGGLSPRAEDNYQTLFNFGTAVTLSAPAALVYTASGPGAYSYYWGTSVSAPQVAGAVGLLLSTKQLTPAMARQRLVDSAQEYADLDAPPLGLDVEALIQAALQEPSGFETVGSLLLSRYAHSATLLEDGTTLIAGGLHHVGPQNESTPSAELYDPETGSFGSTGDLGTARWDHTATRLLDGRVLVAGGSVAGVGGTASAEIYDPSSGTFSPTSEDMTAARALHTATLLPDGRILIVGGSNSPDTAEIYDPVADTFTATGAPLARRARHTATLLPSGKVLIVGSDLSGVLASAELYDPASGTFDWTAGAMGTRRHSHAATLLSNGKVLITGGRDGVADLATAEIYDPDSGTFSPAGDMISTRWGHTATALHDSSVLVTGGAEGTVRLPTSELYDPATDTFTSIGESTGRWRHTANLLLNGWVLLVGGDAEFEGIVEVYRP